MARTVANFLVERLGAWGVRRIYGYPGDAINGILAALRDLPYADYARLLGLDGARVERPEQIGAALDAAFKADRPFVIDVLSDPNMPPLPPHITRSQARQYYEEIAAGDPEADALRKALQIQGKEG